MSAGCKAAQNTLGAGGAWCVEHDVVAFVLFCFVFMRAGENEMCQHVTRVDR